MQVSAWSGRAILVRQSLHDLGWRPFTVGIQGEVVLDSSRHLFVGQSKGWFCWQDVLPERCSIAGSARFGSVKMCFRVGVTSSITRKISAKVTNVRTGERSLNTSGLMLAERARPKGVGRISKVLIRLKGLL